MAKGTKTLRIAAFLAVKEGGHVKWYFLFTRGGEFNFLVILDSVRGYHSMLKDNRIDGWGRTRVGDEIFALPDDLKVKPGGDGQYQKVCCPDARRLMAGTKDMLQKLADDGFSEESHNPGKFVSLNCRDWTAKVYDVYQPPEEMFISDRLGLLFRDFLPQTTV